ncbi:hypothetical protein TNCT_219871 [Trichonephila clavata]|uniref:Uncharacterized protein n=1 Tax=Trichonephila clavata TaxID=2740835 RepID=A0A8X6LU40_TRICU|nr:hypothetical protein TNCT_219871 [Trichonephila clavata]
MTDMTNGRPSSNTDENAERVREIVRADRRLTMDAIASELGISHDNILHDDLKINSIMFLLVYGSKTAITQTKRNENEHVHRFDWHG